MVSWIIAKSFSAVSTHVIIKSSCLWNLFTCQMGTFKHRWINKRKCHSFSCLLFLIGRVAGPTALRLGIPRDQQYFQIVLLAPHQDRTKEGRRCSQSNWSLDDIWVAFPWVWTTGLASPVFRRAFWIHGRTNVVVFSQFGEVVRHSGLCEFHSCAICRDSVTPGA